ncbi:MAG: hypothetical protein HY700_04935 [Gemmatimonadetes bacterium]|nr:hypothetical protein [Gemmatimonadota bacterium]
MPERPKNMLVRVATIAALVLVVGVALVYVSWSSRRGGARLQVDREKIDLGDRVFGEPVRAAFIVTNVGTGTLTLKAPRIADALKGC